MNDLIQLIPKEWGPVAFIAILIVLLFSGGLSAVFVFLTKLANKQAERSDLERQSREECAEKTANALKTQSVLANSNTETLKEMIRERDDRFHELSNRFIECVTRNTLFFERCEETLEKLVNQLERKTDGM